MDAASNLLLLRDVFWYLFTLVEIEGPYGVILNLKMTKILTNIIGQSLLDFPLPAAARYSIIKAQAMLDEGEVTDILRPMEESTSAF
eukprot:4142166-Ditylum_brightwellii.AAC.1